VNDLNNLVSEAVVSGSTQSEASFIQEDDAVGETTAHSLELDIAANNGVDFSWQ
jgi:hypothetical protein